ncbi:MAG: hemerythrin family protein [Thiovulaceae bacterium]|nr:hemerythrin family protein [Sulfurimonadaceae bacterium]MCW9026511.1 hemerythrin family protein [Sulfurimonadaceae bacterium]
MEFDNTKHSLNFEEMDSYHRDFIEIYNSLEYDTSEAYKNVMIKILEQTKLHFCHEEELMSKHKYPRIKEHSDEHKKVLYEMEYFINGSNTIVGRKILKSYFLEGLPSWFDTHLVSMDSDLSSFLKEKINS